MDAVRQRAAEDLWRPVNHQNAVSQDKFEDEMIELGIKNIQDYSYGESVTRKCQLNIRIYEKYMY